MSRESKSGLVATEFKGVGGMRPDRGNAEISQPVKDFIHSGENFKRLFDDSPIGMFQLAAGRICTANQALARMFGHENPEELMLSQEWENFFGETGRLRRMIRDAVESGACVQEEIECVRKDGSTFSSDLSLRAVRALEGEEEIIQGFLEDVSVRRILEEQLHEAQRAGAIGHLTAGVAHDFNNIISAIMMQLPYLQQKANLDAETQETLREVEAEAVRATNLTRQLLSFSRRNAGGITSVDLNRLVANLMDMLKRLLGEDITFRFQAGPESAWVGADVGMMEHVVMNLCINARWTMPEGGRIVIATSRVEFAGQASRENPGAQTGTFVCLSVTDSGYGLDEKVFQRISGQSNPIQASGSRNESLLATVCEIVKQHKGWTTMQATSGQGTSFQIYIPEASGPQHPVETAIVSGEVRGGSETILLVEDDHALRRSVALWLRKQGYAILEASSGVEAVKLWEEHRDKVDLLFSDMVMPDALTGLQLVERFIQEKRALRVMLSSGYETDPAALLIAGRQVTFLGKPYSATILSKVVRHCLDGGR